MLIASPGVERPFAALKVANRGDSGVQQQELRNECVGMLWVTTGRNNSTPVVYLSEENRCASLLLLSTSGTDDPAAPVCGLRPTRWLICMRDAASPLTGSCSGAFTQRRCKTVSRPGHRDQWSPDKQELNYRCKAEFKLRWYIYGLCQSGRLNKVMLSER